MKKILLLVAVALMGVACDDEDHGWYDDSLKQDSRDVTVRSWEYVITDNSEFMFQSVATNMIDQYVCDHGSVQVFMYDGEVQVPLPMVRHRIDDNTGERYTVTTDFDFEAGWINFYVTDSGFPGQFDPGIRDFRVVVTAY